VSIKNIQLEISSHMQLVNDVIRQSLHSEVPLINQVSEYIIDSGGKRIRPSLVLLTAQLFGEIKPQHHQLAAIVEFIHTATLLHDDVVDESDLRRGKSTANHVFGNAASVLVGDFLYSRAFQMMVKLQTMQVMQILANATNTISEGEVLQLLNIGKTKISEQEYLKVIHLKTAKLFEAASALGAVMSGASEQQQQALSDYGMHLGTAFQLIDDVLDLSGDSAEIGKKLGNDLMESKPTLPMIYAMSSGDDNQSKLIENALKKGDVSQLPEIIAALKSTGALDYVRGVAKKEADMAIVAIDQFKDTQPKHLLVELAEFSVKRSY
jgi:octaprenyl-diphosphate synthase